MKKYLFGLIALVMVVCFSAFVSKTWMPKPAVVEDALFWYPVDPVSNNIDHTALINTSGALTKTQMRNASLIPCPEGTGADCIRGFSSQQTIDNSNPGADKTRKQ